MSNLYYKNISSNNHNNDHYISRLLQFHKNFKVHKSQENKTAKIMNELLLSNPDLLENFQRRYSKTPCRLRMKNSFNKNEPNNIKSTRYTNLKLKMNRSLPGKRNHNIKKNIIKKNLRNNNSTPLMKHINEREKEKKRKEKYKNIKKNNNKKSKNVLSRSESFSICDVKYNKNNIMKKLEKNKNPENKDNYEINPINLNLNENICTPKNDNSNSNAYNKINPVHVKSSKSPCKVNKKIYKIESLSQVGYSGPGILKYNQDNFFIYKNLNDESNVLFIGVCDGHGLVGHDVSKYLITNLPNNLNTALKKTNKYISHKETLYSTLKQVFVETNKSLCKVPTIDTKFSGSTCVTIILTKNKIISADVILMENG